MQPLFFTPIVKQFVLDSTYYYKGVIYSVQVLETIVFGSLAPSNLLSDKIKYLETNWIKIVEPDNAYELVKILLLKRG